MIDGYHARLQKNPYYIVAPGYSTKSAGVRTLYYLCHYLNMQGERAYMVHQHYQIDEINNASELYAPLLTKAILDQDYEQGLCPIMVYPETIAGNPYGAPFVVRYYLNFPGYLGGQENDKEDFSLAYTQIIANKLDHVDQILYLPISDPSFFTNISTGKKQGSCFYAAKYQHIHQQKPFGLPDGCVEIDRNPITQFTPNKIVEQLSLSELFYCFENSSLTLESILCGTPAVLMQNDFFKESIAEHELGWDGIARNNSQEEIARAKNTVHQARDNYLNIVKRVDESIQEFATLTQAAVKSKHYDKIVQIPYLNQSHYYKLTILPAQIYNHGRLYGLKSGIAYFIRSCMIILKFPFKFALESLCSVAMKK